MPENQSLYKNEENSITCPVCLDNYYLTEFSSEVCVLHQDWFITTCQICGRACFSDCVGTCPLCTPAFEN